MPTNTRNRRRNNTRLRTAGRPPIINRRRGIQEPPLLNALPIVQPQIMPPRNHVNNHDNRIPWNQNQNDNNNNNNQRPQRNRIRNQNIYNHDFAHSQENNIFNEAMQQQLQNQNVPVIQQIQPVISEGNILRFLNYTINLF